MKKIAVIDLWPEHLSAEKECIERIRRAAASLGREVVVIDKLGRDLETGVEVTRSSVEFVISLHFESPKCYDAHSYVALWNPLAFYFLRGYRPGVRHLASHDDFLSCGSSWADDQVARLIRGDQSRKCPKFWMNHSLAEPILAPEVRSDRRVFYCGINWERLGKTSGRHEELLKILDRRDAIRIYGPDIFHGVRVWEGFNNYVRPLPFDGVSCVRELAACGVALAFSSEAHRQSVLMSNRLFEATAAGAVVICDGNPFAREHFGDTLLYVDINRPQPEIAEQILDRLAWVNANPEAAAELARQSQKIFLEKFCLKRQLAALLEGHEARARALAASYQAQQRHYSVRLIHYHDRYDTLEGLQELAGDLSRQLYPVSQLDVVVDEGVVDAAEIAEAISAAGCETRVHEVRMTSAGKRMVAFGEVVTRLAATGPENELISVSTGPTRFFADHFSSLVRKFEDNPTLRVAISDALFRHLDPSGEERRDLHQVRDIKLLRTLAVHRLGENCLLRFGDIAEDLGPILRYLDDALPYALARSAGDAIAFSRRATVLKHLTPRELACLSLDQQFEIIADCFADEPEAEATAVMPPDMVGQILNLQKIQRRQILIGLARSGMPIRAERLARWAYRKIRRAA